MKTPDVKKSGSKMDCFSGHTNTFALCSVWLWSHPTKVILVIVVLRTAFRDS